MHTPEQSEGPMDTVASIHSSRNRVKDRWTQSHLFIRHGTEWRIDGHSRIYSFVTKQSEESMDTVASIHSSRKRVKDRWTQLHLKAKILSNGVIDYGADTLWAATVSHLTKVHFSSQGSLDQLAKPTFLPRYAHTPFWNRVKDRWTQSHLRVQ